MASLADVYGEDFAKKMAARNYDYLKAPKLPAPPPSTPEQIAEAKKQKEEMSKRLGEIINFDDNIKIGKRCYESFPCQHLCNGQLLGAREIYEMFAKAQFIDKDGNPSKKQNLTSEQDKFIRHIFSNY